MNQIENIDAFIEAFLKNWAYVRTMTADFIRATPADKWEFSPTPKHGPLCKQFRHMVWVTGLYTAAIRDLKMDMSKKKSSYGGSMEKNDLLQALAAKDKELETLLRSLPKNTAMQIDFFGTMMTLPEFLHVLIEHEANHHGMWSIYANMAGFPTPEGWQNDWGL